MPRIWIGRIVILLVALICLVFTVTAIKDNPLLLKDLGQAIQSTQLELSITAFLVVLLAGLSLEINHRNQPQKDPGHGWRRCNPKGEVNTLWEGISTELIGAVISTILLGMVVLIFQQYASIQNRKSELILQMGSDERVWAVEAVRQLRAEGWLDDGTLVDADLRSASLSDTDLGAANLSDANLWEADLSDAYLGFVNLSNAYLGFANLSNAYLGLANLSNAYLREVNLNDSRLRSSDLSAVDLVRANLSDADLRESNLSGANLWEADLSSADLAAANLSNAFLVSADLTNTSFDEGTILPDGTAWTPGTDMERFIAFDHRDFFIPDLSGTSLFQFNLSNANLEAANLSGTDLTAANLSNAFLFAANLSGAHLSVTDLSNANLKESDLSGANLMDANLSNADLFLANLSNTVLGFADLSDANLGTTNLSNALLLEADLTNTLFNEETILPDGTTWTTQTDMTRFTDPEHPEFWNYCIEVNHYRQYCR